MLKRFALWVAVVAAMLTNEDASPAILALSK